MDGHSIMLAVSFVLCVAAFANAWVAYGNWRNAKRNAAIARENLARADRAVEAAKARLAVLRALLPADER